MDFFWIGLSLLLLAAACRLLPARAGWPSLLGAAAGLLLALTCGLYIVADHFTSQGIDESVLYHLSAGLGGTGFGDYVGIMVLGVLLLAVAIGYAMFVRRWLSTQPALRGWGAALGLLLVPAAFAVNPGVRDMAVIGNVYWSAERASSMPAFYHESGPAKLRDGVDTPRNLVLIYAESLERTYLDDALFPHLVPRLRVLEQGALSFSNIVQLPGTGWTIGGMVASQCGVPLVTSTGGNSMAGVESFLPGARCLGDVLGEHGYELGFLGGADLDFAGKGSFYRTHGFDRVQGLAELDALAGDTDYRNAWGLEDDTTFALVRQRFDRLAKRERPFALVTLTLGTHHPRGHVARDCQDTEYRDGGNAMLNAVSCSDQLISRFIEHVRDSPYGDDTVIVLLSDHLAMKNTATELLEQGRRRDLFMALGEGIEPARVDRPGSTLDVAPTVLHLLGFEADRFGLGRNLLRERPTLVEAFSDEHQAIRGMYAGIRNLWEFPSLANGLRVTPAEQRISIGDRDFRLPLLLTLRDDHRVDEVFMPPGLYEHLDRLTRDTALLWIDDCRKVALAQGEAPRAGTCVLAASGPYGRGSVSDHPPSERFELDRNDIDRLFAATGEQTHRLSLAERLSASLNGGRLYADGEPLAAHDLSISPDQLRNIALLEADPLPDHRFIAWQGVEGPARYRSSLTLEEIPLNERIAPIFDVSVPATEGEPAFRSAWAGIAVKGQGVVDEFLAPGNSEHSVARLAIRQADGATLDLRAVGGFAPLNTEHFVRVNGEEVQRPGRGIKMVVLSPDGEVKASNAYDTFASASRADALVADIADADQGDLLLFATRDEFTLAMTPALSRAIRSLGFDFGS